MYTHDNKHSVVEGCGWEKKEENGEEESSHEQLVDIVRGGVNSLPQNVPLLPSEQSPERRQCHHLKMI